ncbi:MAG: CBS domain-containing protein [Anaerolineales bacterium]
MTKLVRDLMHPGVLTCQPDASLGQVAVLLTQHHVHALIVPDRDGRTLGIISDYDLLAGEWLSVDAESLDTMRKLTAAELMSYPVDTIEADMTLKVAASKLIEEDVNRLLVTENGSPVGVISISDFIASIAREEKPQRESVADVMSDVVLVCRAKTPIITAARAMTEAGWRSVLVVDAKGKHLGVVSGKDLMPFVGNGVDESLTVRDVMHPALTININASLREAADLLIQKHHHRLIVVDDEDPDAFPLGVISSFDIVAEMARPGSIWQS